ncbi:hypothetical protein [Actinomadura fibrosa]|uniref:Uncharacterized protein n=1 Tax=Actinomadura fibrosa TaxID=111802 RepID=A0ABW2XZJ7_9ACTN|nr:hypothetical protein [Actinomadura fibrosa]
MTRRPARRATLHLFGLLLGTLFAALLILPLTPQQASACDVSYAYRPSIDLEHFGRTRTCSTGTSLVGVALVSVVTVGALTATGFLVYRRGAATAGTPPGRSAPAPALAAYLQATGLPLPPPNRPPAGGYPPPAGGPPPPAGGYPSPGGYPPSYGRPGGGDAAPPG